MITFKCKMCGGTLKIEEGATVAECEFCGTKQTLPKLDDEKRANLYDRANHFRRNNEFDKATEVYERILNEDKTDAEAYWSIVLCRYGVEYVEDPLSHRRIPTINRTQFTSVYDDDNYKSALKYADTYQRIIYEEEAKEINNIQKKILAISGKEDPFDVFICYKETDGNGKRTRDSVLANDLYYQLKQEGFKVFFSRITLEDKLGTEYEPYIFAALNSAKVMVVLGTKPEYFNAVWVRNEWSRYLALIKQGQDKMLIPAFKDMDPYDLPVEFSHLQAQDMSKLGFMQDLIRGIKKILGKDKKTPEHINEGVVIKQVEHSDKKPILRRAFLFLEDGNYDSANKYAEKVLDIDPECAEAYIVKLLVDLRLNKPSDLANYSIPVTEQPNYRKALRFATPEYKETVEGYNNAILKRLDNEKKASLYAQAVDKMRAHKYDEAIGYFSRITSYKDSAQKTEECRQLKENERLEGIYGKATELLNSGQYDSSVQLFSTIATYKDSKKKIELCKEKKETARKDAVYSRATQRVLSQSTTDVQIKQSIEELKTITGYRDVDDKIRDLDARLEKWYRDKRIAEEKARIKAEEERRTRERLAEEQRIRSEKTRKAVKKATIIGMPCIAVLAIVLVLVFMLIIPAVQFNKAESLLNQGKYEQAQEMYEKLDGFSDSNARIIVIKSIKKIEDNDFEEAIEDILAAGVPVKIVYGLASGNFTKVNYESVKQTQGCDNTALCEVSSSVYQVAPMSEVLDSVEFVYQRAEEFTGLQVPERKGFGFLGWELSNYAYKGGGTFELKLSASWQKNGYDITYNLDGGYFLSQNPNAYDVEDDDFTLYRPHKKGYTFLGWTGTDLDEATLDVVIAKGSTGDREYTANWEANRYSVTLNRNDGNMESLEVEVVYDAPYSLPVLTRAGYTFKGWFNGSKKIEDGIWKGTDDLELTAEWEIIYYDILYNLNQGSNHSSNPDKYTVEDAVVLCEPERRGYTFLGWTFEGQTVPVKNVVIENGTIGEKRYTANWEANSYTLTFIANGGSVSVESQSVIFSESFTLPVPTRDGYIFMGWFNDSIEFVDGVWDKVSDYELIAKWDVIKYTITYDLNKGTNSIYNPSEYTIEESVTLNMPYRMGYTFIGWTFSGQTSPIKDVTIPVGTIGEKSYTANWKANTYTITFNKNNGACDTERMDVIFDEFVNLPVATRVGYTFIGWYDGTLKHSSGIWDTARNVTLTAKWEANRYTLTFNKNGGECSVTSKQVIYDKSYTLPVATRTGYTFAGWYSGQKKYEDGIWQEANSVLLTARWNAKTYTITFDVNGGECDVESKVVVYDSTFSLPTPTKTGYVFAGWKYNGAVVNAGTWTTAEDCTFVASWDAATNTLYKANHYLQNVNDGEYTLYETQSMRGTTDSYVTPEAKVYAGFTSPENQTVKVLPDGSQVVNYYYTRNSYTVSFVTNGGEYISSVSRKYQAVLNLPDGEREGYTFGGWYSDKELSTEFTGTMPAQNITAYAWWTEESKPTDFTYSGSASYTLKNYVGSSSVMSIPAYIGGTPVKEISANAFANKSVLTKVVVPETVTSIGNGAFKGCNAIQDITLPFVGYSIGSTSSNAVFGFIFGYEIGEKSSKGSASLDHINKMYGSQPEGTVWQYSKQYNSDYRYSYYYYIPTGIKNVTITVQTDIPVAAFNNCDFIENIKLPENVTSIGDYAFDDCALLKRLNSQTDGEYNIPEAVTKIGAYTFYNNNMLQVFISGSVIESIGHNAFSGCSMLTRFNSETQNEIIVPQGTTSIGNQAFRDVLLVAKVSVPDSVTSIGYGAFKGCNAIQDITLPFVGYSIDSTSSNAVFGYIFGYETANAREMYYEYNADTKEKSGYTHHSQRSSVYSNRIVGTADSVYYPAETVWQYSCYDYLKNSYYYLESYYYYIPTSIKNVTITVQTDIPVAAFNNCDFIENIKLPENVTSIGDYAFDDCVSLNRLNSQSDGEYNISEAVTKIGTHTFYNNNMLQVFSSGSVIESIGQYAFSGCSMLSKFNSETQNELILHEGVTSIGSYAFRDVLLVTKVSVPDSVTSIGEGAFKGCDALQDITLPFIGYSITSTRMYAVFGYIFGYDTADAKDKGYEYNADTKEKSRASYYTGLSNSYVNKVVGTSSSEYYPANTIWQYSCYDKYYSSYYYLQSYYYYIPTSIKNVTITVQTDIPVAAFNNCDFIENINLPSYVNTFGSVGEYAFRNCNASLNYEIIPTVSSPWNGSEIATTYNGGTGSEDDPYIIFNGEQLAYFAQQVNSGVNYEGTYFTLSSNINLNNREFPVIGETIETAFSGCFDGRGFTIKNLKITATGVYNGLFGYCSGIIKNLGIESCSLTISNSENTDVYGGGLAGYLTGTLENCFVEAINSTNTLYKGYVGGLVGYNVGSVINCYANGTLTTNYTYTGYVGGLVGYNGGNIGSSYADVDTVSNSTNFMAYAGGLVGYNNASLAKCFAYGDVSAKGSAEPYSRNGGLIGLIGESSVVTDCYRYEGQELTKYTTVDNSYCDEGTVASHDAIIAFCLGNWDNEIWQFEEGLPVLK